MYIVKTYIERVSINLATTFGSLDGLVNADLERSGFSARGVSDTAVNDAVYGSSTGHLKIARVVVFEQPIKE